MRQTGRQAGPQTDTDRQRDRQPDTDRQAGRQTDRQYVCVSCLCEPKSEVNGYEEFISTGQQECKYKRNSKNIRN